MNLILVSYVADFVWKALCVGGCAVAVFGCGASGWWFALAVVLAVGL